MTKCSHPRRPRPPGLPDVTATDAARNFADLLDAVEHRGEHFTIVRRGKAIADLEALVDEDDIAIAAITVAEMRAGALLARGRTRTALAAHVDEIAAGIPILDYDLAVAEAHAVLLAHVRNQGRPRGAHDLVIAATAKAPSAERS